MTSPDLELDVTSDFDSDVWVAWRRSHEPGWAQEEAELCYSEIEDPYDDEQVAGLAAQLQVLDDHLTADPTVATAFAYLPAPAAGVAFDVTVELLVLGDGSDDALVRLATRGRAGLTEPNVEPFEGLLGAGLRVQQHVQLDDGTVFDTLAYVWHRPDLGTDVRVAVRSLDLGALLDAEDEVEELARGIDVAAVDPDA